MDTVAEIIFVVVVLLAINILSWFRLKVIGGLTARQRVVFLSILDIAFVAYIIYFFLSGKRL